MRDKVIVIVGATGGIGSTLTEKLLPLGAKLVLAARSSHRLDALVAQSAALSTSQILSVPTDITDFEQVDHLMQKAIDQFGKIDVLINAAGVGILKPYNKLGQPESRSQQDVAP